jgi:hypothetical protein
MYFTPEEGFPPTFHDPTWRAEEKATPREAEVELGPHSTQEYSQVEF